jgi:signal transduction histidine kinase
MEKICSGSATILKDSHNFRTQLVGLGSLEVKLIHEAGSLISLDFSAIIDRFYERLLNYEPLREIIAKNTTTVRLKDTFKKYLERLFSGQYDDDYDHQRIKVGLTHDRVNLPLMWYLAMFSALEQLIFEELYPHYENRPLKDWVGVQKAISSLIKYDQLLAVDAYVDASFSRLQQKTAEAEKARKAKSIFLATVSHELRTPLSSILGYSDLILDTAAEISDQTKQYLEILRRNAGNLLTLINALIEIGRVDSGKGASDTCSGSINALLSDIADDAEGLVAGRPIKIERLYSTKPDPQVYLDFAKLRQVILNIVGNACKFTDAGSVCIDKIQSDEAITITISDTGPGIPEELRTRIFDEFFRVQGNRKPGSGLGLSLVKTLVESMNGHIVVEANNPTGSRFSVTIKLGT